MPTKEETEAEIEMLAKQIISVLNNSKIDDDRGKSIAAGKVLSLFDALIITLGSVKSLDYRKRLCKCVEDLMPAGLEDVMQQPAQKEYHLR